jgi:hypothetical protein
MARVVHRAHTLIHDVVLRVVVSLHIITTLSVAKYAIVFSLQVETAKLSSLHPTSSQMLSHPRRALINPAIFPKDLLRLISFTSFTAREAVCGPFAQEYIPICLL